MFLRHTWRPAVALALLAGCGSIGGGPSDEAAELVTMGSQRPLREPLRPIRGGTRVLVFALDGVGADDLTGALAAGAMPNLAAFLGAGGDGGIFEHARLTTLLSVLPSATTPAWSSIFTGAPPAETGIPGNEWFDRTTLRFYAPVPVTIDRRTHALQLYTDELMSEILRASTVYQRVGLRSHVSLHPVFRGADLLTMPNLAAFGDLFTALVEAVATQGSTRSREVFAETDLTSVRSLRAAFDDVGVPDLQVAYFPGPDLYTHESENPVAGQREYLSTVTDRAIGEVLGAYSERGLLDSTYVLLISDHGHTPVLRRDANSLHVGGEDEPAAVLEAAGFRVRPASLDPDETDYQAALAFQGGMAYVYLADRSTCPTPGDACEWSRGPRLREDVLPVARAFYRASRSGDAVPALAGSIDLVLARSSGADGASTAFRVFDGERLIPIGEYLRANPRPDLLDLERRLEWLSVGAYGHLAGDVLLLARSSTQDPLSARFYFGPPYWSEHGSARREDSIVPLILAHAHRSGAELDSVLRQLMGPEPTQLDIAGLIEGLLRGSESGEGGSP